MMGATPSSAVQQTAYLEALDQYINYDEHDNFRACLSDANGERLKDAEGNPKTLRHRFAIYCDDIAAGADTLEEVYELYEALICCCYQAGIQIKAGKVKFGVNKLVFHAQLHDFKTWNRTKGGQLVLFPKHERAQ
jgi:hypothetical protein